MSLSPSAHPKRPLFWLFFFVFLLLAAGGLWFLRQPERPLRPARAPTAHADPKPARPFANTELEVPPEPPKRKHRAAPALRKDSWSCDGTIDPTEARSAMQEYATAVRSCYERELRGDPTLEGQLILSLKINQLGDVASVQTEGSFASNALYQCVRNVARRFKLPRPKEGDCAVVTVPYRFRPKL